MSMSACMAPLSDGEQQSDYRDESLEHKAAVARNRPAHRPREALATGALRAQPATRLQRVPEPVPQCVRAAGQAKAADEAVVVTTSAAPWPNNDLTGNPITPIATMQTTAGTDQATATIDET
jgi:hypothetical protein